MVELDDTLGITGDRSSEGLEDKLVIFCELDIAMGERESDGSTILVPGDTPVSDVTDHGRGLKAGTHDFEVSETFGFLGLSIEGVVTREDSVEINERV